MLARTSIGVSVADDGQTRHWISVGCARLWPSLEKDEIQIPEVRHMWRREAPY
jgi:hypothetical protein